MSLLEETCIICLSEEDVIPFSEFYGCTCRGCVFHPQCFEIYRQQFRYCPLCRREDPIDESVHVFVEDEEEIPVTEQQYRFITRPCCVFISFTILGLASYAFFEILLV